MDNGDFVQNFERQWHEQVEGAKHQIIMQRLQAINQQIRTFEYRYGGTFQDLLGRLNDLEIDEMSEAVDIADWKKLIEARKRLIEKYDRDDIPDGIYAVSPAPDQGRVQVRRLYEYCRERGLNPSQLSEAEMAQFIVYPDKDGEQEKNGISP
ncbi:hypothetical protein C7445_109130 [Alicyclobacillus sacchari]|uniref:Uncharacterized protein n=1 Tax=Alicyclobacillus sacchari TaxID=392010 RepID=A0A4R8LKF5_9BACL|nr:hypothetical protein [Alicyclobacillus sacchari]TDY44631.1 hypothetical protein C7445_109130 [Alicyclobacillus sacchari]GMA57993.1 hypothetical protein GCM10025858_24960 [Alicyclobacillus sacchari]